MIESNLNYNGQILPIYLDDSGKAWVDVSAVCEAVGLPIERFALIDAVELEKVTRKYFVNRESQIVEVAPADVVLTFAEVAGSTAFADYIKNIDK